MSSGRKVTMNDLFAEPEDAECKTAASNAINEKMKKLDGMNTKSRVVIQKTAVQGEFGAKKFIKPCRTGTKSQQQYAPKGFKSGGRKVG